MAIFKNRSSWIITILVLLNIATLASIWFAPPRPPHGRIDRFLQKELNLTDEQQAQFKVLKEVHIAKTKDHVEAAQKYKKQVFEALAETPPDNDLIDELLKKESEEHAFLEKALVQHFMDLKAICSDEQQEKLNEFFGKMMKHPGPTPSK